MIVGLTGGIGSGKSTVAGFFAELGAYLIDWDELSRQVVEPGKKAWQAIVDHFGDQVLLDDRRLDRQRISSIVFNNEEERSALNTIVHPEVCIEDARLTKERLRTHPSELIVKDIPLLIEGSLTWMVEKVVVVHASDENRLKRLAEKGVPREEALRRISTQLPLEEKAKSADFVIHNDGDLEETRRQVREIFTELMRFEG
jgi:dephospho-CoA kinase